MATVYFLIFGLVILLVATVVILFMKLQKPESNKEILQQLFMNQNELNNRVSEQFANIEKRLGEGLYKSSEKTSEIMNKLHERLALIDEAQKNIKQLGGEVANFTSLLSNKQSRGAYGEMQMEDLIKEMLPPNVYEFQCVLKNGKRCDCLIKMPEPTGNIVIDAKFPLEAYQALVRAKSDSEKVNAERFFRDSVTKHIKDISEKYVGGEDSGDSAIMFLPSESVYAELFANFANLVNVSFKHRVWIVSPTTLMATLTTMRAVLKDARIKEQTKIIQKELGFLNEDMGRLQTRVGNLDSHFRLAQKDVEEIGISASKIIGRSKKIQEIDGEK
ncbi:MAG: DNA recombination protein RmuC [Rickettsiales bacterium]|jgi:DNA recombination protein RmuC|nr:DNA recombination protein RmuC [Rickettsiales bacterium]